MLMCDICNSEASSAADGAIVTARDFRENVRGGNFDPFRLSLVEVNNLKSREENHALWCQVVDANEADWFLCAECNRAYQAASAGRKPRVAAVDRPTPAGSAAVLPQTLDTLRRTQPRPALPPVPADWKPGLLAGLFGPPKPWGDTLQAAELIRQGRIAEGRELLRRIAAHSKELDARLHLCLESLRPPDDDRIVPNNVFPMVPREQRDSVTAIRAFFLRDGNQLGESFLAASDRPLPTAYSAHCFLLAWLAFSDTWLQTQILHPRKRQVDSVMMTGVVKAFTLVLSRRFDEAWLLFGEATAAPENIMELYQKQLKVELEPAERRRLVSTVQLTARVGQGLVLAELGHTQLSRPHFHTLAAEFEGRNAEACRLLS